MIQTDLLVRRVLSQTILSFAGVGFVGFGAWAGPQGTTIEGTMTASTTLTQVSTYSWGLVESAQFPNQVPFVILTGSSASVGFTITATRSGPVTTQSNTPITGQICLSNTGASSTRGLHLKDQVEQEVSPGVWKKIFGPVTLLVPTEIPAYTTYCFPDLMNIQKSVELDPNSNYRNHAVATIDNFIGYEGMAHSIDIFAPVVITVTQKEVDASAILVDPITCPSGFECTPSGTTLEVHHTMSYPLSVLTVNQSAACGQLLLIADLSTLTPVDSRIPIIAEASIPIYTGTCH